MNAGGPDLNEAAAPTHTFSFKEGEMYGYIAEISEDDRKAGKAAGDVLMFRYAGFWNGANHLEEVTDDGEIEIVAERSDPCDQGLRGRVRKKNSLQSAERNR